MKSIARRNTRLFFRRLRRMVGQPIFISLTIFGNAVIFTSSGLLYVLETGVNPSIRTPLDTLWWAVSTVTTVGYGDVIPVTGPGRIVGIFTMILGTALFWSYTALFAEALVSEDLMDAENELRHILRNLENLAAREQTGEETRRWIHDLQAHLKKRPSPKR